MVNLCIGPYERCVVCNVEKPNNQMTYIYTFIITNMESSPEYLIKFYCKRGLMENFIKESKTGFDFASVSGHTRIVNANRLQIHALAYNIFNWFRRLALYTNMRKLGIPKKPNIVITLSTVTFINPSISTYYITYLSYDST